MENNNRSSSHAVFNIKLHIVFVTKYRRKTLSPEVLAYLKEAFSVVQTLQGVLAQRYQTGRY